MFCVLVQGQGPKAGISCGGRVVVLVFAASLLLAPTTLSQLHHGIVAHQASVALHLPARAPAFCLFHLFHLLNLLHTLVADGTIANIFTVPLFKAARINANLPSN